MSSPRSTSKEWASSRCPTSRYLSVAESLGNVMTEHSHCPQGVSPRIPAEVPLRPPISDVPARDLAVSEVRPRLHSGALYGQRVRFSPRAIATSPMLQSHSEIMEFQTRLRDALGSESRGTCERC